MSRIITVKVTGAELVFSILFMVDNKTQLCCFPDGYNIDYDKHLFVLGQKKALTFALGRSTELAKIPAVAIWLLSVVYC